MAKKIYRAVVIDDEKHARESLKTILKMNWPQIQVVAEADSVESGVLVVNEINPEVVFLDINLSDGSGFNVLEQLKQIDFQLIFVTAYNNFAIQAFKVNALDYILKPINMEDLSHAISRLEREEAKINKSTLQEITQNWFNRNGQGSKIAIREFDGVRYIDISKILRCQSHNNYTEIYLLQGEKIMTSRTLKEYDSILENHGFFRIYQSHLVNLSHLKKIVNKDGLFVEMDNGDLLELSRGKRDALFEIMETFRI